MNPSIQNAEMESNSTVILAELAGEQGVSHDLDLTIVALNYRRSMIGACAFRSQNQRLFLIEDFTTRDVIAHLEHLLVQCKPNILIVNGSLEFKLLSWLESNKSSGNYDLVLRPSKDFEEKNASQFIRVFSKLPLYAKESTVMCGTIGAILLYLDIYSTSTGFCYDYECMTTEFLQLSDYLYVDRNSLMALQVIGPDSTASKGRTTLLQLLQFARSKSGAKMLKAWILAPLSKLANLQERQDAICALLKMENRPILDGLVESLPKIPEISEALNQVRGGFQGYSAWIKLYDFVSHSHAIYELVEGLSALNHDVHIFKVLASCYDMTNLSNLNSIFFKTIDYERTKELKKPSVLHGVDPQLDEYKAIYNGMEERLAEKAYELSQLLPRGMSGCLNIAYIPQLGYLILLEGEQEAIITLIKNRNWHEIFRTSTTVYCKNDDMQILDEKYGDTYSMICDCEIEIFQDLAELVVNDLPNMSELATQLARLDCLVALARVAQTYNYVKPELTESPVIELTQCRHPIFETMIPSFIPNDVTIGSLNEEKGCVVSGSNLSGKSVYMTQIGLIVYLAHIGSFVPASKAKIGICDKILTRVVSGDTVSKHNSTFATDIQQAEKCLRLASSKSLVLVDEFGKGTDMDDGPSLFGAFVKAMVSKKEESPRAVFVTHFVDMFKYDDLRDFIAPCNLAYWSMDVLLEESSVESPNEGLNGMTYLYKIRSGISSGSFGLYCAEKCGIESPIIKRAKLFVHLLEKGESLIHFCNQLDEEEQLYLSLAREAIREFVMLDFDVEQDASILKERIMHILSPFK